MVTRNTSKIILPLLLGFLASPSARAIDKWGFIDKAGKFLVNPQYKAVADFDEGKAIVAIFDNTNPFAESKQFVSIDQQGNSLGNRPSCLFGKSTKHELFAQRLDDRFGFVDKDGTLRIAPQFVYASDFEDGVALVRSKAGDPYHLIDAKCKVLKTFDLGMKLFWSDGILVGTYNYGDFYFFDKIGTLIGKIDGYYFGDFSEGLCRVTDPKTGNTGFADSTGKLVIPTIYKKACGFSEGMSAVRTKDNWIYVDKAGQQVISLPRTFTRAGFFSEGLAPVLVSTRNTQSEHTKLGFIDKTGKLVIAARFSPDSIFSTKFSDGLACVRFRNHATGCWGYIDRSGKVVIAPKFTDCRSFVRSVAAVATGPSPRRFTSTEWRQIEESKNPTENNRAELAFLFFKDFDVFKMSRAEIEKNLGKGTDIGNETITFPFVFAGCGVLPADTGLEIRFRNNRLIKYGIRSNHQVKWLTSKDRFGTFGEPETAWEK